MLKSNLCDQSEAYIPVKGTITFAPAPPPAVNSNNNHKKLVFKNCAPFTDCISEINNTQIDNAKDIYLVMLMYNLMEYSNNYTKTSGNLWQYYRDKNDSTDPGTIKIFMIMIATVLLLNLTKKTQLSQQLVVQKMSK